ncbi:MAG TPA: hypothetical protein VG917_01465 [Patescibacteria group bacterium]|nr:hypothetical protein [Patescibacteria group bacterium]
MAEYLKHEYTARPLDVQTQRIRSRNYKGDAPETDLPRYKPGDKIIGSIPFVHPQEYSAPAFYIDLDKESDRRDPLSRTIDIVWSSLGQQYGTENAQGLIELEKPQRVLELIDLTNQSLAKTYPQFKPISPDQVLWLTPEGVQAIIKEIPPKYPITQAASENIGIKLNNTSIDTIHFTTTGTEPIARFGFDANAYKGLTETDKPWEKIFVELNFVTDLILCSIDQSISESVVPLTDEAVRTLNRYLDKALRESRKAGIGQNEARTLLSSYRKFVNERRDAVLYARGSALEFRARTTSGNDEGNYELLFGMDSLNQEIENRIKLPALSNAMDLLELDYPDEFRNAVIMSCNEYIKSLPIMSKSTANFLVSLGMDKIGKLAEAYLNSEIPTKYLEAKKKRKSLEYPL